jgi:lysophospholipase L1-like esterase
MRKQFSIRGVEVLAVLFVIASFLVYIWTSPREYPHDKIVVAFGDSLTRGYGTPPGKNFVTFLSEYTKIAIINSGKTGDTSSDALVRLKEDVLDYHPDVVLVLLGGNDFFEGYSEEVVRANLKTILRRIKQSGAKVILIGGSKQIVPNYESTFERLVYDEGVDGYVPNILGGILFRKDLLFDTIHPNERGHEIIAGRILPVLERVLREG